jgi:hypothetical protein
MRKNIPDTKLTNHAYISTLLDHLHEMFRSKSDLVIPTPVSRITSCFVSLIGMISILSSLSVSKTEGSVSER